MRRTWTVGAQASRLTAETSTAFFASGRESHAERTAMLPGPARSLAMTAGLRSEGEERGLLDTDMHEERLPSGDIRLHRTAIPARGTFNAGDVLLTHLDAEFDTTVSRDMIYLERPARILALRVCVNGAPQHIPPARLTSYRVGDGLGDLDQISPPIPIPPTQGHGGNDCLEHIVRFPAPNTLYVLEWEVTF